MRPREEQPARTLILRELETGPSTIHELEEVLKIHRRNIRHYLKLLHDNEEIHVGSWEQRTGPALPVWHLGGGADKKRPQRKRKRRKTLKESDK